MKSIYNKGFLTPDDLAILNRDNHFVVEPGMFKVMIGASSEDIKLNGTFEIKPLN